MRLLPNTPIHSLTNNLISLQLLDDTVFEEECRQKSICVISILPDILDTGAEGRNNYLKIIKDLGDKYKKRKFGYVMPEIIFLYSIALLILNQSKCFNMLLLFRIYMAVPYKNSKLMCL